MNKNTILSLIIVFVGSMIASWIIGFEGLKGFCIALLTAITVSIGFYYTKKDASYR